MAVLFEEDPRLAGLRLRGREVRRDQYRRPTLSQNPYYVQGGLTSSAADWIERSRLSGEQRGIERQQQLARALLGDRQMDAPPPRRVGTAERMLPPTWREPVRGFFGAPPSQRQTYEELRPKSTLELQSIAGYSPPRAPASTLTTAMKNAAAIFPRRGRRPGESQAEWDAYVAQNERDRSSHIRDESVELPPWVGRMIGEDMDKISSTESADASLEIALNLIKTRGVETGAFQPFISWVKGIAKELGADSEPFLQSLGGEQFLQALSSQHALILRNPSSGLGLTGNTSDKDLRFLVGAVFGLGKTAAANEALIIMQIAANRRSRAKAEMRSGLLSEHGTAGLHRMNTEWNKWINEEENSFLTAEERARIDELLGATTAEAVVGDGGEQGGNLAPGEGAGHPDARR